MPALSEVAHAEWILNSALQCILILLVGSLFLRLFRRGGAPLRSAISLMTMLVVITLPFLSPTLEDWGLVPFHASLPVTIGAAGGSGSTSIEIATEIPSGESQQEEAAHRRGILPAHHPSSRGTSGRAEGGGRPLDPVS